MEHARWNAEHDGANTFKEGFMEWKIVETVASPETGTIFGKVETSYGLNYILWFKGDYYVRTGEVVTMTEKGILIDNRRRRVWVAHAMPYSSVRWLGFRMKNECPGNRRETRQRCDHTLPCQFKLCPFGLKNYSPESYYTVEINNSERKAL
ncbi:anti-adapter protein IraM [Lelliottia amnigena]|nr:anti-adapter protein IraM [Lelliottia amnigena]